MKFCGAFELTLHGHDESVYSVYKSIILWQ